MLAAGALLAWALGLVQPIPPLGVSSLLVVTPAWDLATLIGLGVPLYLVTMASQNLPGFAVLRAFGYKPPSQPVLAVTGLASLATAFVGAHTSNLAAISAALCTGPEAHPDPAKRWIAGVFYALWWGLIALFGASLVGLFGALPPALLMTVAGLGLAGLDGERVGRRAGTGEGPLRRCGHACGHRVGHHADGRRLGVLGACVRSAGAGAGKRALQASSGRPRPRHRKLIVW